MIKVEGKEGFTSLWGKWTLERALSFCSFWWCVSLMLLYLRKAATGKGGDRRESKGNTGQGSRGIN